MDLNPLAFSRYPCKSFEYSEKDKFDRFSLCLTTISFAKIYEKHCWHEQYGILHHYRCLE